MAKQSGLHQLRGKVGEHSYYRQTGIDSGIVRSINQAMSGKVKNDEAFVNTRLNNAEFGQAGRIASVLGQYITPKYRPMILPFSQSKMAKVILEYIKNDTTMPWGQRNINTTNSGEMQVAALNSVVKNRFDDFSLTVKVDEETSKLKVVSSAEFVNKLSAIGANGAYFRFIATSTWIGTYQTSTGKYADSFARGNIYDYMLENPTEDSEFEFTYTLRPAPPQGWPAIMATRTGILVIMPYRMVSGDAHVLQEHCSFKAFIIQDGAVN